MMKTKHTTPKHGDRLFHISFIVILLISLASCGGAMLSNTPTPLATLPINHTITSYPPAETPRILVKSTSTVFPTPFAEWKFNRVDNAIWSPDSQHILIVWGITSDISNPHRWESSASLYHLNTLNKVWEADDFSEDAIYSIDGKTIITSDVSIRLWDAMTGKFLDTLYEHGNASLYLAFLAKKPQILLGRTFDEGNENSLTEIGILNTAQKTLDVHIKQVSNLFKLSVASDESQFLTVATNVKDSVRTDMVFLWDLASWQKKCSFPGDDAVFLPNQDAIAVVTQGDGEIYTYDRNTCANIDVLNEKSYINSFAVSPDGQLFAFVRENKTIKVQSVKDGKLKHQIDMIHSTVSNISFSPDGHFLLAISFSNSENKSREYIVQIWRIFTQE